MMALRGRRPNEAEQSDDKTIEINAQMQGSLSFKDPVNLKINGDFSGNLETKGTLTVGNKAKVEANIEGDNVIIAGLVKGDITAHKMLVLMPTASLRGNISTPKLNIVEGAIFQGNCQMSEPLLSVDEVAKYLEIDIHEVENMANSGKIPATRNGNSWRFERSQIDNWASSLRVS
ncbi:MAG: polymer-forming cytoskeletal protein [Candidatus Omnitrophica bacterium]|nr:polymer-forming cytoskeletal protein [Candidatus Omnitrophota bacterium]